MNEAPLYNYSAAPNNRVRAPGAVVWMFVGSPLLIAIGAFITVAMQPFVTVRAAAGDAVLVAWIGVILLCLGLAFLIAAIVLVGVRSMLRQQTQLLRGAQIEKRGG